MHESYITMNRESLDHRISRTNTTLPNGRGSHQRFSVINGGLRSFAKFTGKYLCQSLFFNKVAGLGPEACNFIKKETLTQVLSCEFCKILNFFT